MNQLANQTFSLGDITIDDARRTNTAASTQGKRSYTAEIKAREERRAIFEIAMRQRDREMKDYREFLDLKYTSVVNKSNDSLYS